MIERLNTRGRGLNIRDRGTWHMGMVMKCIFISHIITTQKLAQWAHEQKDVGRDESYVWAQ